MASISELPEKVAALGKEHKQIFGRMFSISRGTGLLKLPEEMKAWADKSFGDHKLLEKQNVVKVFGKLKYETALFNEIRSKRPISAKSDEDAKLAIEKSKGDPFCQPLKMTPQDSFGRVKGWRCVSATNVAKFDALHGLVIFKKHDPLDFDQKDIQDYVATAHKWFAKAHKHDKDALYPFLLWNCLWRSGASIIHGHMQMVLGKQEHYAEAEQFKAVSQAYQRTYSSDYFEDLFELHKALGLGFKDGKTSVFVSITPRKDKEITMIATKLDAAMAKTIFKVADCYRKELGVESFNVGIILPPLKLEEDWSGFPVIARIVDRGSLSNKTSDLGGIEMYARSVVIETDPYKVFETLKKRF